MILLYALFPALVIIHWVGQLSILGRKLQPIKRKKKKKNTKENVECSFLFESKTQPLYCTYTEINNNHMNMKYLVIFSYIKRLPCTLSTENNSSPSKVIFLFQFRYYFTCRVFSIENFCRFVIHLSGYFSHYHFSLHLKFCICIQRIIKTF